MRSTLRHIAILVLAAVLAVSGAKPALAQSAIAVSPASGTSGSAINVTGSGFAAGETGITVTYDGTPVASGISASPQGAWTATFSIPPSASGPHSIGAFGSVTLQGSVPAATFTVSPAISISRTTGTAGASVGVTGAGFGAGESGITVTYDGIPVAQGIFAGPQGAWTAAFVVPGSVAGAHGIGAYGSSTPAGSVPTATFTISPQISASRSGGTAGASVTVSGAGFGSFETGITVTYDGTPVASGISAGSQGTWSASFVVPASAGGNHIIGAYGSTTPGSFVPSATFTISPTVSVSRTTGSAGTSVTLTGAGFGASETGITITYDGTPVASGISASSQGAWSASFSVPPSASGAHGIGVYGSSTSAGSFPGLTFTVSPTVTISRASGTSGASVTVTGAGFGAAETGITVTYDGTTVASGISASSQGAWSAALVVPPSASGPHRIAVSGSVTSAGSVPGLTFTVTPSMTISQSSGTAGVAVTVTGAGFGAGETGITITYDGTAVTSGISASPQGAWSGSLLVPASASGPHNVGAYGSKTSGGSVPTAVFNVNPMIAISRSSGTAGVSVTVTGSGFGAGETGITVTYDTIPVAAGILANSRGSWSGTFAVPASPSGTHTIQAYGSLTPMGSLSEVNFAIAPGITVNPDFGYVGMAVQITGSGFAANSPVRLSYDDRDIPTRGAATDGSGSFSASIEIPRSRAGPHTIRVVDGQDNDSKVTFTMNSIPPPVPIPLSPGDGAVVGIMGDITPTFRWSNVTDPSGVTFTLQVDTYPDFSQPVLQKTDLALPKYTVAAVESLPRGTYYWRVETVNGASVESGWSQTQLLHSGLPLWFLIAVSILAAAAAGTGVYFALVRPRVRRREAVALPALEMPRLPQLPQAQPRMIESGEAARQPQLPMRLALPEPAKETSTLTTQDQARLIAIIDFARSLPLVEPGYKVDWLVELMETGTGTQASAPEYEQLLKGELELRYDPAWMRHPVYQDLTAALEGQSVLEDLNAFFDAVNQCAAQAASLLQAVYSAAVPEVSADFLEKGGWGFISAVYSDAMSWFRGTSLRDPSERDYTIKRDSEAGAETIWLYGEEATPFPGRLIQASDEQEALRLRSVHLGLRRTYRTNNQARQVATMIAELEVRRSRLRAVLSQIGSLKA